MFVAVQSSLPPPRRPSGAVLQQVQDSHPMVPRSDIFAKASHPPPGTPTLSSRLTRHIALWIIATGQVW